MGSSLSPHNKDKDAHEYFVGLSDEILLRIFSLLDAKDVESAKAVCWQFHRVAEDRKYLWRKLYARRWNLDEEELALYKIDDWKELYIVRHKCEVAMKKIPELAPLFGTDEEKIAVLSRLFVDREQGPDGEVEIEVYGPLEREFVLNQGLNYLVSQLGTTNEKLLKTALNVMLHFQDGGTIQEERYAFVMVNEKEKVEAPIGAMKHLFRLVSHTDDAVLSAVDLLLDGISRYVVMEEIFREMGGFEFALKLIDSKNDHSVESGLYLAKYFLLSVENVRKFEAMGGLDILMRLVKNPKVASVSANLLQDMIERGSVDKFERMGALSYFIQQALSGTPNDKSIAYRVLSSYIMRTKKVQLLEEHKFYDELRKMLESEDRILVTSALQTLSEFLSVEHELKRQNPLADTFEFVVNLTLSERCPNILQCCSLTMVMMQFMEDIPELIVQSPWMHRLREALDDEQSDTLIPLITIFTCEEPFAVKFVECECLEALLAWIANPPVSEVEDAEAHYLQSIANCCELSPASGTVIAPYVGVLLDIVSMSVDNIPSGALATLAFAARFGDIRAEIRQTSAGLDFESYAHAIYDEADPSIKVFIVLYFAFHTLDHPDVLPSVENLAVIANFCERHYPIKPGVLEEDFKTLAPFIPLLGSRYTEVHLFLAWLLLYICLTFPNTGRSMCRAFVMEHARTLTGALQRARETGSPLAPSLVNLAAELHVLLFSAQH